MLLISFVLVGSFVLFRVAGECAFMFDMLLAWFS